ncbi:acyl-CoA dehydrogenase [Curvibacter sp. APW13]|uniref:acyl-CoA dehydrogenase n=1 Tax=Curvibacter sp. APW13 TaxID=3077236 RepID=UPI0028DFBC47|nr:acyl-CoA dehydrogenase [Curvibacter sp. APW13]MDT8991494.1 acyl-CoA dehydrogenase [Curvibacter sp. APW13]
MNDYIAPLDHLRFALEHVADFSRLTQVPGFEVWNADTTRRWLASAGRFFADVWAPTNQPADRAGAFLEQGRVVVYPPFADVYRQTMEGGWNVLPRHPSPQEPGIPWMVHAVGIELMASSNGSFSMLTGLIAGAIELLELHASPEQQAQYVPKLRSGEWAGAMDLSEPEAGSDLGALRTKAVLQADGSYRLFGSKRFISWADHDLTPNIVHLVLARTPNAPAGTAGISCFIVPKFLPDAQGSPGVRNDIHCAKVERNMGFRASPTCMMQLGDAGGAVGYLIGKEGDGMRIMFTMMNSNRLATALGAMGIAERAYQAACAYTRLRVQGVPPGAARGAPIVHHPDVRRMLMTMRCHIDGMRALCYFLAGCFDMASHAPSPSERQHYQALADLLTPVAKSWCTEVGSEVTSLAIQLHGGSGFVEDTGVAQHYRDIRIMSIFEGTNGIQAQDLVARKLARNDAEPVRQLLERLSAQAAAAQQSGDVLSASGRALAHATDCLRTATDWMLAQSQGTSRDAISGACAYQRLFGAVVVASLLLRGAQSAGELLNGSDSDKPGYNPRFLQARTASAGFFAEQVLPLFVAWASPAMAGCDTLFSTPEEWL